MHHSNEERIDNLEKRVAELERIVRRYMTPDNVPAPQSGGGPGSEDGPG